MRRIALVTSPEEFKEVIDKLEGMLPELEDSYEQYDDYYDLPDEYKEFTSRADAEDSLYFSLQQIQKVIYEELLPVLKEILENVVSRPDEAKKYARLKSSAKKIEDFMGDSFGTGYPRFRTVVNVVKAVKHLANQWGRIEKYKGIERRIPHGPFTLVNEYGFSPEEYAPALGVLDDAAERIRAHRFDQILYGDVVFSTHAAVSKVANGDAIGLYLTKEDLIYLAVEGDTSISDVAVLIHEFGHRLWDKFIRAEKQDDYREASGWASERQIGEFWDAMAAEGFVLRRALKYLDPSLKTSFASGWRLYFARLRREYGFSPDRMRQFLTDAAHRMGSWKSRFIDTFEVEPVGDVPGVTEYAETHPEEDFCETFMYFCMDWPMTEAVRARFLDAVY